LPLYLSRNSVEQIFDIGKNCVDLLPLRTHNELTFRGHLMVSFFATIVYVLTTQMLDTTNFSPTGIYHCMRNLSISYYDNNKFIIKELDKKMNDIVKHFKFDLPKSIF
jgi:transposase